MTPAVYTAAATVLVALITVVGTKIFNRRQNEISGASEIVAAAMQLVDPQKDRITELIESVDLMAAKVSQLTQKIMRLERHVDVLTKQIVEMGATPHRMEEIEDGNY